MSKADLLSLLQPGSLGMGFTLSATLIVAIGAQNAFVLRQGLRREHVGPIVGLCIALDAVLMAIGVFGLAGVGRVSPRVLDALLLGGAAFLAVYGWSAARRAWAPGSLTVDARSASPQAVGPVLVQALAMSLLNPHTWLDTVVLVGAVGAQQPPGRPFGFWLGAALASTVWFVLLGYGARLLAPVFARPVAWRCLDGVVALTMWSLAGLMLWGLLAGGAAAAIGAPPPR